MFFAEPKTCSIKNQRCVSKLFSGTSQLTVAPKSYIVLIGTEKYHDTRKNNVCKQTNNFASLPAHSRNSRNSFNITKKIQFFSNPPTRAPRKQEKRNLTLKQHLVNGVGLLLLPGCCWDSGDSLFFLFAQVKAMGKWVG